MNILFLSTHLKSGGITSYLLTLTKGFISQGHKVHIVSSGGNMEEDFKSLGAIIVKKNILTKSEINPKIYLAAFELKRYILENDIDVIHSHTRVTQVIGAILKRIVNKSYVSTCHGYFKPKLFRSLFPCWGDGVIAISSAVQKHLEDDFKVESKNIYLVQSGIDLNQFKLIDDSLKRKNRLKYNLGEGFFVGIVARLSDVKGQDILIHAMKKVVKEIPEAKLLLFGEGKLKNLLKKLINDYGLNNSILFYPVVNKTFECLSMLDIFVMPSRKEGLGLSIMEAQACGLPVIASNIGGIPSLIEHEKTGILVEPENVEDLSEAIMDLLKNKEKSKNIGLSARKIAEQNYSLDKMVNKTLDVYKKVII